MMAPTVQPDDRSIRHGRARREREELPHEPRERGRIAVEREDHHEANELLVCEYHAQSGPTGRPVEERPATIDEVRERLGPLAVGVVGVHSRPVGVNEGPTPFGIGIAELCRRKIGGLLDGERLDGRTGEAQQKRLGGLAGPEVLTRAKDGQVNLRLSRTTGDESLTGLVDRPFDPAAEEGENRCDSVAWEFLVRRQRTTEPMGPFRDRLMGIYSRLIFPKLCDWAMSTPEFAQLRKKVLADVRGEILEIGFGTGLNLEHYPEHVRGLAAVDPGEAMNRIARTRIGKSPIEVDLQSQSAQALPFEAERFDFVVCTWTLCSIPDASSAVAEVLRVLKPGGRFVFVEHGLSDQPGVQRWQRRLNPIQRRIGVGCRLDLDVDAVVRSQPFRQVTFERFLMEKAPRTHGTMYQGTAVK
jgi:ubiquinone/menaquinone biosynthesis C-methylase UbiE